MNYETIKIRVVKQGHDLNYYKALDSFGKEYVLSRASAVHFNSIKVGDNLTAFVCTTNSTVAEVLYPELDQLADTLKSSI